MRCGSSRETDGVVVRTNLNTSNESGVSAEAAEIPKKYPAGSDICAKGELCHKLLKSTSYLVTSEAFPLVHDHRE